MLLHSMGIELIFKILDKNKIKMLQASYKYTDGSEYKGEWNNEGQRHGFGMLILNDGTNIWANG